MFVLSKWQRLVLMKRYVPRWAHFYTVIPPSWITQQISIENCAHQGASARRECKTKFKIVTWTKQTWTKQHNTVQKVLSSLLADHSVKTTAALVITDHWSRISHSGLLSNNQRASMTWLNHDKNESNWKTWLTWWIGAQPKANAGSVSTLVTLSWGPVRLSCPLLLVHSQKQIRVDVCFPCFSAEGEDAGAAGAREVPQVPASRLRCWRLPSRQSINQ